MRAVSVFGLSVFAAVHAACITPSYSMTTSTAAALPPKPATCDFRVVNLPPGDDYEEIATLTPIRYATGSPEEFKRLVRPDVCRVGGDVVVTEVNGFGEYVRGTVLRKTAR